MIINIIIFVDGVINNFDVELVKIAASLLRAYVLVSFLLMGRCRSSGNLTLFRNKAAIGKPHECLERFRCDQSEVKYVFDTFS